MNHCLIVPDFRGIGGAQLYALRRIKYLAAKGIKTSIIVGLLDKTILDEKSEVSLFQHEMISKLAFDVKRMDRKDVLSSFIKWNNEEVEIIESYDPVGATWGEYLASNFKCKHVIYSLIEPQVYKNIQDKPILDFFEFKLKRVEFIGLSSVSLEIIFNRKFSGSDNRYVNVPFDEDELTDNSAIDISQYISPGKFVIGTISRLEKGYVEELIKATISFSNLYKESQFVLIIAGESEVGDYRQMFESKYVFSKSKPENLSIIFPGYIRPLGKDFFGKLDLFVGMGTGSVSAISQGCATIVVDPINNRSSGIFGVDTNNFAYSESGIQYSILESFVGIYTNKNRFASAKSVGKALFEKEYEANICLNKLDTYIDQGLENPNRYWNINHIGFANSAIRYIYRNKNKHIIKYLNTIRKRVSDKVI